MIRFLRTCGLMAALLIVAASAYCTPLGTEFTYQGSLNEAGAPATGNYDFEFSVYSVPNGGSPLGNHVTLLNVTVTAGVFTVNLDFGTQFVDDERWLQIEVRPANVGSYTTLTPRQLVTGAPVAQFALNGGSWRKTGTGNLYNINDGNAVLVNRNYRITGSEYFGIDTPASGYGGMYINSESASGKPFYGYATGGTDRAWTYYDSGTSSWRLNLGGDRMTVTSDGHVGINTTLPALARLEVEDSEDDAIRGVTTDPGSYGVYGSGPKAGLFGVSSASGYGVWGSSSSGVAVFGSTNGGGFGIYGSNGGGSNGWAGYFSGRVHVAGTLSKLSGSFMIDHPLDPANKTLSHSFVESPDMMNLYNGNVTTGADGRATITLPDWFETLNRDFRYQITPIGSFARAMVETEIEGNRFVIRTEEPNVRVSWQVSGIRHDAYAKAHPIVVEAEKSAAEKGTYLFPEGYEKAAITGSKGAVKGGR